MGYNLPNTGQSSTLTEDERAAEAKRILRRMDAAISKSSSGERPEIPRGWTKQAFDFVEERLAGMSLGAPIYVTVPQLFWLRDLAEKLDD